MKNIQLSCRQGTRSLVKAAAFSVVLLLTLNFNLSAQDLPPIPGGGDPGGTPREPTPEELEAQRKAQEARWQQNAEQFQEWLVPQLVFDGQPVQNLAEVDEIQRARLLSLGEENKVKNEASFRAAQEWATANNAPTKFQTERGERFKLVGFEDGRPQYHKFLGLHEATVVGASKLWPGGGLGLSLSGSGTVVGLWDQDDVFLTHTELNGRVIDKDGTTVISQHATAVAGTLAAMGISSSHKGVSYQATVHAYDSFGDTGEMPAAAANDGVRVSNHSYSFAAGWQGGGSGTDWTWWGDTTVDFYEDYKFGFYGPEAHGIDSIVYNAPYYLPVWASGNETGKGPLNNGANGHEHDNAPPGQLFYDVHHANGPDGYDTILRHGTAKNILTVGAVSLPSGGYTGPSSVTLWSSSSTGRRTSASSPIWSRRALTSPRFSLREDTDQEAVAPVMPRPSSPGWPTCSSSGTPSFMVPTDHGSTPPSRACSSTPPTSAVSIPALTTSMAGACPTGNAPSTSSTPMSPPATEPATSPNRISRRLFLSRDPASVSPSAVRARSR